VPAKRAIRPDDLYRLRSVGDPQLSPDGTRVAYVVGAPNREKDVTETSIWIAPSAGHGEPRQFTNGAKDGAPRWSPDGRRMAFVSDRGESMQLYIAPLDGGEPRAMTKAKFGVSSPAWSPDGTRIVYVSRTGKYKEPKDRTPVEKSAPNVVRHLQYRLDGAGQFDSRRQHLFVLDLESGESRQITTGDWNDGQPCFSPDGRTIAFVSDRERARHDRLWRADVWVIPAGGGRARRITRARGSAGSPAFSPDGKLIAYVGHEDGDESYARNKLLYVVPVRGSKAPRAASQSLDRSAAGWPFALAGSTLAWLPRSDGLLFLAFDHGSCRLYRASVANGSTRLVLKGDRQIDAISLGRDGRRLALTAASIAAPPEVYVTTLSSGSLRDVSHAQAEFVREVELQPLRRTTHRAADGLPIESFHVRPKRKGPTPTVLEIHGGPHGMHPNALSLHATQCLAAAGYTVLLPNPRGSTGYGERFTQGCVRDWGGDDFEDLMGAVDDLVHRGIADPERLYVSGYSYGGFMTSWVVGHTRRFRAAVIGAPVTDLLSMFGTSDVPVFTAHETGGLPWEAPEDYRKRSPLTYVEDVRTPVMLTHWEGDLRCPIGQSEQLFASLRMLGREVELVRYPGGAHGVRTPAQGVDRLERVMAWYKRHAPHRAKRGRA
jgi:dipeptidyl aminopeptidase/acylaminoacyl peptidase